MTLSNYISVFDAVVQLMDPLVEIVVHDIAQNSIAYINGSLSKRIVGDESLLDQERIDDIKQISYPKINFDGRLVKSISVRLEKNYLLCINCDISLFHSMQELSYALIQKNVDKQPSSLFTDDWQEKLHTSIHNFLQKQNLLFDKINGREKKNLTKHLFEIGAFKEKNAADYIAKVLDLSRSTVFKYLKEWRK